jgi:hypothetical protein
MAERIEQEPELGAEKLEASQLKKLEAEKTPELSKSEREAGEKDLAKRHEAAERKISAEKKRESELEKEKNNPEKAENKAPHTKPASHLTKKEKASVYTKQIKTVQAQLPRASRTFSKVVHNAAVEKVSDAAGKTIFRPSALIGGAIVGLAAGITVYSIARYYGYFMPSWLLPILLLLGALFGVAAELILNRLRPE